MNVTSAKHIKIALWGKESPMKFDLIQRNCFEKFTDR